MKEKKKLAVDDGALHLLDLAEHNNQRTWTTAAVTALIQAVRVIERRTRRAS